MARSCLLVSLARHRSFTRLTESPSRTFSLLSHRPFLRFKYFLSEKRGERRFVARSGERVVCNNNMYKEHGFYMCRTRTWEKSTLTSPILLTSDIDQLNDCVAS